MRIVIVICFYIPVLLSILNVQSFISKFISESFAQYLAYLNLILILIGTIIFLKKKESFSSLVKLWFVFFACYYLFALIANAISNTQPAILKTLIPLIYFIGFAVLLSIPEQRLKVSKILSIGFLISCIFIIIFNYYNFSLDYDGVYEYSLERAGGVYGDANNASLAAILSFVFLKHTWQPQKSILKAFKVIGLIISTYAILITFSKTGFIVFLVVLGLTYHKFFHVKRILLAILLIPVFLIIIINWALSSDLLSKVQKLRIESLVNIFTLQTDKVGFSERDVLFKNLLSNIYENPILGNGVDFAVSIRGHNTIFGVWADAGIITFIVFLIIIITYFRKAIKANYEIKYFALSVLFALTMFMISLQTIINQAYLMVVFVFISYLVNDKKSSDYYMSSEQKKTN